MPVFIAVATYSDTNDRISSHGGNVPSSLDVVVMQQRNHSGHRGKGHICHAVGLLDIDYSFVHLLIDKQVELRGC